jgi:apolipoprotein N-acyltransferase
MVTIRKSLLLSLIPAILSGILLTLSFPDFEFWWLAWMALVPFLYSIYLGRNSFFTSILSGWIFGTVFIYGTCWWLTYAPIHYAEFNPALAYFIMFLVAAGVGVFFALFSLIQGRMLRRYGPRAAMLAPVLWAGIEYLRYLLTGNAWNAIGYSQAFIPQLIQPAKYGSVFLVGFLVVAFNAALFYLFLERSRKSITVFSLILVFVSGLILLSQPAKRDNSLLDAYKPEALIIAVQPNVPMSGLNDAEWKKLRAKQGEMAEQALAKAQRGGFPTVVVLPESPMDYQYDVDSEFRDFLRTYTRRNNVSVLFNSAEPSRETQQFYNSAVMVNENGAKVAQYNKIHLMPFGEYVPMGDVLSPVMPPLLGSFAFGTETNLVPFGGARGGVMICFESHFPSLSRQFVLNGADVLIEITNDGYLGPTPVLKQHFANAVFRAVETDRPLLRVTNIGISGYITPDGQIRGQTESYVEDTMVWNVTKSDGGQTVYVRYGDWFAVLCAVISLVLMALSFKKRNMSTDKHG